MTTRSRTRRLARLGAALALLVGTAAVACESSTTVVTSPDAGGIAVNGTGKVTVTPDIALISLGVEARGATVAEARRDAASALDAVRASLRRNSVEDRDITTQALNIRPEYGTRPFPSAPEPATPGGAARPPVAPGQPVIVGYVASNIVSIKVRNIDNASKVLDDAVAAGGDETRVHGIQFTVDRPERFEAEARELAIKDARAHAEALASNAGVKLGPPRSIAESFGGPIPFEARATAPSLAQGDVPTPISPGESEIVLNVSVVYEIE